MCVNVYDVIEMCGGYKRPITAKRGPADDLNVWYAIIRNIGSPEFSRSIYNKFFSSGS